MSQTPAESSGFRTWMLIWAGQFASLIGGGLTGFALGIYVYQRTGSASALSVVFVLSALPFIMVSPVAGVFVDRWGAKRCLVLSTSATLVVSAVLAGLLVVGYLPLWAIWVIVAAISVIGAVEVPAFVSLAPTLLSAEQLGRANGMRTFAIATSEIIAPVASGSLITLGGLRLVVVVDVLLTLFALITLALVPVHRRVPDPGGPTDDEDVPDDGAPARGVLGEIADGWSYLRERRGLMALMLFLAGINLSAGFIDILLTPLVLAFATPRQLGLVMTLGGVGILLTSVVLMVRGTPARRIRTILLCASVLALATLVGASRPSTLVVASAAFVFLAALGVLNTTQTSIWQLKVEERIRGRVISLLSACVAVPNLIAYAAAGPLVDRVFVPWVGEDRVERRSLVPIIGDGSGRGIALLMMVLGLLLLLTTLIASAYPALRCLETDLPDAADVVDDAPGAPDDVSPAAGADARPGATGAGTRSER